MEVSDQYHDGTAVPVVTELLRHWAFHGWAVEPAWVLSSDPTTHPG